MKSHAEFLRRAANDDELVEAILRDYKTAKISAAELAMLDYCVQVTEDAVLVRPHSLEALRSNGFDDTAILQMTLIAAWFNYINRVADALGIGRSEINSEE